MPDENAILDQLKALGDELRFRLDRLDRRLQALEEAAATVPVAAVQPSADSGLDLDPGAPARTVDVTISPLHDVSRVRVVEAAFEAIEGVDSVSLQTLSGNTAELVVTVPEGVALISGLRRTLQLAFDVGESDSSSFTIALAQPGAEREGGVAARKAS